MAPVRDPDFIADPASRSRRWWWKLAVGGVAVSLFVLFPCPARADDDWLVTLYGGQYAGNRVSDTVGFHWHDSYVLGFGVTKEFAQIREHLRWEIEGQALPAHRTGAS